MNGNFVGLDGWKESHARDEPDVPTATIIECEAEYESAHTAMAYSPGWGYRDDATGEVTNGKSHGEVWDELQAKANAIDAGFEVKS